jgi:hypothetical protein
LGHISHLPPDPSLSPPPPPPHFQAEPVLTFTTILLIREDISNNKKDKMFLLVEIRIAIQRDSYHWFHAQVYYNPN